jgi:7-cyano-7-deazaguanine synthase
MTQKAVLLISGGADSATMLAIATKANYQIHAISFDYGQKNKVELNNVTKLLQNYPVASHKIIKIDLGAFGGSTLTEEGAKIEKYQHIEDLPKDTASSFVPARNTVFLSLGLAFAESIKAYDIFIGTHESDTGNYPDCKPVFIEAFQALANVATSITSADKKITIHSPLMHLTKADVIALGLSLGVDYGNTISCYDPSPEGLSCGQCLSCKIRLDAFSKNNIKDPAPYIDE